MPRNKGQLSSDGAYNSGTDQDSAQDDSRPEISCTHCGVSSTLRPHYAATEDRYRKRFDYSGLSNPLHTPATGELGSDADANNSNYEPATVEEHSALVSLANGDNSNMLENGLSWREADEVKHGNSFDMGNKILILQEVGNFTIHTTETPLPTAIMIYGLWLSWAFSLVDCEIWFLAAEDGCMILASAVICNLCKLYAIKMCSESIGRAYSTNSLVKVKNPVSLEEESFKHPTPDRLICEGHEEVRRGVSTLTV
uniref:Uncharacterized protein n=1 Tax=Brassica oleracea var. oleracea TaxID=109376 RepID=A0A0D3CQ80_BRAOL